MTPENRAPVRRNGSWEEGRIAAAGGGDWRWTAAVFLCSRAIVLTIILVSAQAQVVRHTFGGHVSETRVELRPVAAVVQDALVVGDAEWFRSIAMSGYAPGPFDASTQRNWAFFPAWPYLVRAVGFLPFGVAGALLANLCFLGGLLCFRRAASLSGFDDDAADAATLAIAFFPSSYFFSVPVSESLFFLLSSAAVVLMLQRRWWPAAALIAVAGATRVTGVLLIGVAFLLHRVVEERWFSRKLACLLCAPLGLAAFMFHLYRLTGNAFAFADLQLLWRRHPSQVFEPLLGALRGWPVISSEWNFIALQFAVAAGLVAACVHLAVQRRFAFLFFVGTSLLVVLSSGSLQSLNRYALSAWPAFFSVGALIRGGLRRQMWIAGSAALLGVFCLLYALRVDIALA